MVDHAAQMDEIYRGQRHIYDLTRKYYLLGRDRLIEGLAPPPGGTVLEIGCGTARNLIRAARAWPDARFYGLDISAAMLEVARAQVARAGVAHRVVLAQGDAAAFDPSALFGVHAFDRVMQSYTLSMIPDWTGAIAQAATHLGPGGSLHIVDFGQQEGLPRWWRRALFAWLARFDVTPRAALRSALVEVAGTAMARDFQPLYRGYAWRARLDRR